MNPIIEWFVLGFVAGGCIGFMIGVFTKFYRVYENPKQRNEKLGREDEQGRTDRSQ